MRAFLNTEIPYVYGIIQGLATASPGGGGGRLTNYVSARLSGLMIATHYPIVRCRTAAFDASSFSGVESFSGKGVLGVLIDLGGGALLYVFTTHMAAFGTLAGSQQQANEIVSFIDTSFQEATALYGGQGRIGVVITGDFNLNANSSAEYTMLRRALASPSPSSGTLSTWSSTSTPFLIFQIVRVCLFVCLFVCLQNF